MREAEVPARRGGADGPLHPTAVAPRAAARPVPAARPPHPATTAQPRVALAGPAARPPHPATTVQPRAALAGPAAGPPHPATVAPRQPCAASPERGGRARDASIQRASDPVYHQGQRIWFPQDFRDELDRLADQQPAFHDSSSEDESDEDEKEGEIPTWPGKMSEKISSAVATAMHGDKQKKLPRWLPYVRSRSNPDLVVSKAQGANQIFVRLDKVSSDREAREAARRAGGTVVKDKSGHYYGFITSVE